MAMNYGLSFQPQNNGNGGPNGEQKRVAPVQEAVKLLSLRLPTHAGPSAIAPQALLHGQGAAGAETGGYSLDAALQLLRKLRAPGLIPPQMEMPQPAPAPAQQYPTATIVKDGQTIYRVGPVPGGGGSRDSDRSRDSGGSGGSAANGGYMTPDEARERGVAWQPRSAFEVSRPQPQPDRGIDFSQLGSLFRASAGGVAGITDDSRSHDPADW